MRKYALAPEALLFGSLKKDIYADLVSNGIPSHLAGSILSYFDPAEDDYLRHVDLWQTLLCQCWTDCPTEFPAAFVDAGVISVRNNLGYLTASALMVKNIHQVAKMLYKFHGKPRKDTEWESVKHRFRHPGTVQLNAREVEAVRSVLSVLRPPKSWFDLSGRFGPGITAEGLDKVCRWTFTGVSFPTQVPFQLYDLNLLDCLFGKDFSKATPSFHKYGITKIAEVPKSIKTNRIVSSEPALNMYAQLAVGDYLVSELHRCFGKDATREISLDDQVAHREHLYERVVRHSATRLPNGSMFHETHDIPYATIDLSDASDHVSRSLVSKILPDWWSYLSSVRSTFARFPDGEIVPMRTFAPMGSGVCFPVLTATCYGLCKSVVGRDRVYVYGDDIIVPLDKYEACVDLLTRGGLIVNTGKSSATGRYREACGCEVFEPLHTSYGCNAVHCPLDVTPAMLREPPWKVDSATLELWVEKFAQLSWDRTRASLIASSKARATKMRWNDELQRLEVRVVARRPRSYSYEDLPWWAGLARWYAIRSQKDDDAPAAIRIPSSDTLLRQAFEPASSYPVLTSELITHLQEQK